MELSGRETHDERRRGRASWRCPVTGPPVTVALVILLDLDVAIGNVIAGSTGLLLLVVGFGTVGLAVGAITGRRTIGLGLAAGLAVLAFVLDAIGPTVEAGWMTAISPFSWHRARRRPRAPVGRSADDGERHAVVALGTDHLDDGTGDT